MRLMASQSPLGNREGMKPCLISQSQETCRNHRKPFRREVEIAIIAIKEEFAAESGIFLSGALMSLRRSHPAPVFLYLMLVIFYTMFTNSRAVLLLSLTAGFLTELICNPKKIKPKTWLWNFLFFAFIVILNPLFNQNGEALLIIGNLKITEEALLAGVDIALMILAVIYWFNLFNQIVSADKFIYLFGRLLPNTVLLLSMGLRYLPLLTKQGERIQQAQRTLGIYEEGFFKKIKSYIKTYVALVSWSLENAIDTAVAMKARGYGSTRRTNYGPYRFRKSDFTFIVFTVALFTVTLFEPNFRIFYGAVFLFAGALLEIKENLKWHYLKSKI